MADQKVRIHFPLAEQDPSVQPQKAQEPMTPEAVQAMIVAEFERMFDCTVKDKCRICSNFVKCSILSAITNKNIVGTNNTR